VEDRLSHFFKIIPFLLAMSRNFPAICRMLPPLNIINFNIFKETNLTGTDFTEALTILF